jgi:L-lactate utilization protein LutB
MKVFIWKWVEECSENYHSDGGVVVFAKDERRAREIANNIKGCNIKDGEKVDVVKSIEECEEQVFIFPDAGCC